VGAAYGLLTPLGRGVLVLGLVATALAVWLNWQEFAQLGVAVLALVALALAWQVLPGLPTTRLTLRPDRVSAGGAPARLRVETQAPVAPMLFPKLSVPVGAREVALRLPFLGPFAGHDETVDLPALPRGAYDVGPVRYVKTDPLGLVARAFDTGEAAQLLVAPEVIDLTVFAGGLTNDLEGATSQQLSMSDLAFHALREYVPGDDLRHVHWRSSAKAGELLVRQYHETRRGHVTVLVDEAASSYPGRHDFELAVSAAASIALRAVGDEFDLYLRCGAHRARGRTAIAMTDAACHFASGADDYLATAADAAAEVTGTGLVVQVTGSARPLADLHAAASRFDHDAAWLVVRADAAAPPRLADTPRLRELSVPDLPSLRELLGGGLR
jgi:uncharacterized protein (DUF58 family)